MGLLLTGLERTERLVRVTATLPQGAAAAIFTIAGGNVELINILGEATVAIGAATNNVKLTWNPTGTGASTDLCTILDTDADIVGTFYSISGAVGGQLQDGLWMVEGMSNPLILGPGTIDLDVSGSTTGSIAWTIWYRKMEEASTLVTA